MTGPIMNIFNTYLEAPNVRFKFTFGKPNVIFERDACELFEGRLEDRARRNVSQDCVLAL